MKSLKAEKEKNLKQELKDVAEDLDENTKRCFMQAQEKGAGSWLTVLPVQSLNKELVSRQYSAKIWMVNTKHTIILCMRG